MKESAVIGISVIASAAAYLMGWSSGFEYGDSGSEPDARSSPPRHSPAQPPAEHVNLAKWREASLEEIESTLKEDEFASLTVIEQHAVLLRLTELDPRRLIDLLELRGELRSGAWKWCEYLARNHRSLVEDAAADARLSRENRRHLRSVLERTPLDTGAPGEVLDSILKEPNIAGARERARDALTELSKQDPGSALDYLTRLLSAGMHGDLLRQAPLQVIADHDPEGMLVAFRAATNPELKSKMAAVLGKTFARIDSLRARAFVDSLPPSPAKCRAVLEVAAIWGEQEPDETLGWIRENWPEGGAEMGGRGKRPLVIGGRATGGGRPPACPGVQPAFEKLAHLVYPHRKAFAADERA